MAVPIIIGANIGTSVTNTIVAFTQISDRETFRRAFSAATVHDMFNWCAVLVFLPIEVATGVLEFLSLKTAEGLLGNSASEVKILKYITEPFTDLIVQVGYETSTKIIKLQDHVFW
jgi:sodium-dependent phosphate cotransporter